MKKRIAIYFFVCCALIYNLNAQSTEKVNWYSFEEAAALNKVKPKKVFIDIFTDWCGWCKVLDKNTFSHPTIIKLLNENFYPVKLNAERKDTIIFNGYTFINPNPESSRSPHQLASALLKGRMGYPSMVFMNDSMHIITTVQSYLSPGDLEPALVWVKDNKYTNEDYQIFLKTFVSEIPAVTNTTESTAKKNYVLNQVTFNTGNAILSSSSFSQLDSLAGLLKASNEVKYEISGYTDNTGNTEANKTLSEQRAKAVFDYLIAKGVPSGQLSYKGYGSLNPIAGNDTEAGRKKNRRVELKVVSN